MSNQQKQTAPIGLFLGDIPQQLPEEEMIATFSEYGEISRVDFRYDKKKKKRLAYGFVYFKDDEAPQEILAHGDKFPIGEYILRVGLAERNTTLMMKNIPPQIKEHVLISWLRAFGQVSEFDYDTEESKCYVSFSTRSEAEKTKRNLENRVIFPSDLRVSVLPERQTPQPDNDSEELHADALGKLLVEWCDSKTIANTVYVVRSSAEILPANQSPYTFTVSESQLQMYFERFGVVERVSIPALKEKSQFVAKILYGKNSKGVKATREAVAHSDSFGTLFGRQLSLTATLPNSLHPTQLQPPQPAQPAVTRVKEAKPKCDPDTKNQPLLSQPTPFPSSPSPRLAPSPAFFSQHPAPSQPSYQPPQETEPSSPLFAIPSLNPYAPSFTPSSTHTVLHHHYATPSDLFPSLHTPLEPQLPSNSRQRMPAMVTVPDSLSSHHSYASASQTEPLSPSVITAHDSFDSSFINFNSTTRRSMSPTLSFQTATFSHPSLIDFTSVGFPSLADSEDQDSIPRPAIPDSFSESFDYPVSFAEHLSVPSSLFDHPAVVSQRGCTSSFASSLYGYSTFTSPSLNERTAPAVMVRLLDEPPSVVLEPDGWVMETANGEEADWAECRFCGSFVALGELDTHEMYCEQDTLNLVLQESLQARREDRKVEKAIEEEVEEEEEPDEENWEEHSDSLEGVLPSRLSSHIRRKEKYTPIGDHQKKADIRFQNRTQQYLRKALDRPQSKQPVKKREIDRPSHHTEKRKYEKKIVEMRHALPKIDESKQLIEEETE
ncbi:hypothetical protein BLNAU_19436 [Blattamonas nauphoetae]|uniref:RRM domain-containing protein n=1 Tax=Blattamonas nauphoetae TaxID=2049346 RepID=A0ABQ9X2R3_9EUKA|nr:hypothetical protein BLNAU_19436 [Blattamonas nauphoetae]